VISKAGKKTYGLDHFFSGLQQKLIPSLSFFVAALVSVNQWRLFPVCGANGMQRRRKSSLQSQEIGEKYQNRRAQPQAGTSQK
jgi:hypothetical protein